MTHLFPDPPSPDFAAFAAVLRGERAPARVHLVELSMDGAIMRALNERFFHDEWVEWAGGFEVTPPEAVYAQTVRLYWRLGYDCAPVWATWPGHPRPDYRVTEDGQRSWTEEGAGLIGSWEDFERFPWDTLHADTRQVDYAARHLPDGMKLTVNTTLFEHVFEYLLGLEGLAYLLYDAPDLVDAVFQRWGEKVYAFYEATIGHEAVGAIFHADDMGFKTGTLIAPRDLRRLVLPWHKRFAALAHEHGKLFCLHSDGNLYRSGLIDDLIDDVGIDGFHAFEENIMPVTRFKATYGARVATLGGVDIDRLVRLDEAALRQYIRDIIGQCMIDGRYAFGTGNTVANYVPLDHYLIMLEEARRASNRQW